MIPFVTFWFRIQKVLYGLIAKNPFRAMMYGSLVSGSANTFNTSVLNVDGIGSRVSLTPPSLSDAMIPAIWN